MPAGIDEAKIRTALLRTYNMEIGAGLGPFKGKVWRIGLMGESSRRENVVLVLNALEQLLEAAGVEIVRGRALAAADAVYAAANRCKQPRGPQLLKPEACRNVAHSNESWLQRERHRQRRFSARNGPTIRGVITNERFNSRHRSAAASGESICH